MIGVKRPDHYRNNANFTTHSILAPFAVDGTTLTPRARAKMKGREDTKAPTDPSVSEVCAGVRSCLEELNVAGGGGRGGEGEGGGGMERKGGGGMRGGVRGGGRGGGGGSLVQSASVVHQLHHLRRQLHRLRVNCLI
ncbi:hypothetical protein Pcinc_033418 [Petrolisthes cinctipes]|uniref:Uncharacterized protein n=1 Tax=Petrolisthes cinctipes TaxID=88211 RepID=A0AAE1ESD0_PETCI|nr:hypothetical protein Pcinc_033418 [Petrolisthes cinctipes]